MVKGTGGKPGSPEGQRRLDQLAMVYVEAAVRRLTKEEALRLARKLLKSFEFYANNIGGTVWIAHGPPSTENSAIIPCNSIRAGQSVAGERIEPTVREATLGVLTEHSVFASGALVLVPVVRYAR
jgi:hypothetical protein